MIKIQNRDGTYVNSFSEYSFDSWKFDDVNEIWIEWNPDQYISKVMYLYDGDVLVGSWLIENYKYDKNENKWTLIVYPLIYDLRQDFIQDVTWFIPYYNMDLADVIEDIITKYRATIANPVLYIKSKQLTWITVKYSFDHKTWLEWYNFLVKEYLNWENFVIVDPDGGITIKTSSTQHEMTFWSDILHISYEKMTDEIINFVKFDNGIPWDWHILLDYQDNASITAFWKRVAYIKDSRFKYEESVDEYMANFFEKHAWPKIVVDSIKTQDLSVKMFDTISISNWEKTFEDELYVVWMTYYKDGIIDLKIWTTLKRNDYTPPESIDVSWDILNQANQYTDTQVAWIPVYTPPVYIKETYIDSTEIRSPIIAGNTGYIYDKLLVGPNGIIIDGTNELIRSTNYVAWSSGWKIDDTWNAEFNNATLRGNLLAGSININNNFTVDSSGNVRWNDFVNKTILFENLWSTPSVQDWKMWCDPSPWWGWKVLWWYFWNDSTKQQISTSRMQSSWAFDRTSSTTITLNMWFQPRVIIFNWFFENTSQDIYWTTNWQAWSVSSSQWFCNAGSFDYQYLTYFARDTNLDWVVDSNYTSVWVPQQIKIANITDSLWADSVSKNVYIYVSSWTDSSITLSVNVSSGWRFAWNYTILW